MSEFVELQKRIEKCAEIYDVIRRGSWTSTESLGLGSVGIGIPLDSVDSFFDGNKAEIAAMEIMGVIERKEGPLSVTVEYPDACDSIAIMRANYKSLQNEDDPNFDMACDGYETYVHEIHPPSEANYLADRVGSFEQFVGLCLEIAERRIETDEVNELIDTPDAVTVPRNIFALCIDEYESIIGPHIYIYETDNIAHRTLIEAGLVSIRHSDQLVGSRYSGYPDGETQFNEHRKACRRAEEAYGWITGFAWSVAQDVRTTRDFIKKCAESVAKEMMAERQQEFNRKLDEVGCP
jgi:hypothetical protein